MCKHPLREPILRQLYVGVSEQREAKSPPCCRSVHLIARMPVTETPARVGLGSAFSSDSFCTSAFIWPFPENKPRTSFWGRPANQSNYGVVTFCWKSKNGWRDADQLHANVVENSADRLSSFPPSKCVHSSYNSRSQLMPGGAAELPWHARISCPLR